jgi:hypothetical protein
VLGPPWLDHDPLAHGSSLRRVAEEPLLVLRSGFRYRNMSGRHHHKEWVRRVAVSPDCCLSSVQNSPFLAVGPSRRCSQDEFRETNDARSGGHSHHRNSRKIQGFEGLLYRQAVA